MIAAASATSWTTITTILSGVIGAGTLTALLALLLFPAQRAKLGAEREAVKISSEVSLAGGYGELVAALRTEIERLEAKVTRLDESLEASRRQNARLDETVELARRESAKLRADLAKFSDTINGTS